MVFVASTLSIAPLSNHGRFNIHFPTHLAELLALVVWQQVAQTLESCIDALHPSSLVAVGDLSPHLLVVQHHAATLLLATRRTGLAGLLQDLFAVAPVAARTGARASTAVAVLLQLLQMLLLDAVLVLLRGCPVNEAAKRKVELEKDSWVSGGFQVNLMH